MKRLLTAATLGLALMAFGCAGGMRMGGEPPVTKQTKVKCPKCGVEFSVGEGLKAYEMSR
ncbi:MAG: hypothetical protein Kow0092_01320 [Deferrisomatales bacterium]